MKRILFFFALAGVLSSCTPGFLGIDDTNPPSSSSDGYTAVAEGDLPQSILDYIAANYPDASINCAQMDDDGYEVYISAGLELNFNLSGNFLYADDEDDWCGSSEGNNDGSSDGNTDGNGSGADEGYVAVDINDLPQAIIDYVAANYPGVTIEFAQMDDDGYEIDLSNGLELNFDLNGNFLYADDYDYDDDYDGDGDSDGDDDYDYGDDDEDYTSIAVEDLPQSILDFVSVNYPSQTIVSAQMDDDGYEVFLSNGVELNFGLNGDFLYAG